MPVWLGMLALVPLLLAAWAAGREADPRQARRLGMAGTAASLAVTLLAYLWDFLGMSGSGLLIDVPAWGGWPAYISFVGLIAVGLSPVRSLYPGTVGRILQVTALSILAVAVGHPVAMIALTAAAMVPVWLELGARAETLASARVFGWHMVPSALLMLAGGVLYELNVESLALPMLCVGVLIRAAMVPCHRWLPDLVEHAPMGIVTVLVAPQLGVFALLRLVTLGVSAETVSLLAAVGALTALYAAAIGVRKRRVRTTLGCLIMSQGGLVVLGFAHGGTLAWTGTLVTAMAAGLAAAGLIMAVAALETDRGPLTFQMPTGGLARLRWLATAVFVLGMACVGLPGILGLTARDLVVQGVILGWPLVSGALLLATALNGVSVVTNVVRLLTAAAGVAVPNGPSASGSWHS